MQARSLTLALRVEENSVSGASQPREHRQSTTRRGRTAYMMDRGGRDTLGITTVGVLPGSTYAANPCSASFSVLCTRPYRSHYPSIFVRPRSVKRSSRLFARRSPKTGARSRCARARRCRAGTAGRGRWAGRAGSGRAVGRGPWEGSTDGILSDTFACTDAHGAPTPARPQRFRLPRSAAPTTPTRRFRSL